MKDCRSAVSHMRPLQVWKGSSLCPTTREANLVLKDSQLGNNLKKSCSDFRQNGWALKQTPL